MKQNIRNIATGYKGLSDKDYFRRANAIGKLFLIAFWIVVVSFGMFILLLPAFLFNDLFGGGEFTFTIFVILGLFIVVRVGNKIDPFLQMVMKSVPQKRDN